MDYNNIEIIGIDHGWAMMKTFSQVFTAGLGEIKTEPAIYENLLEYEGRFFRVGGERLTVKPTKVTDENYYLLTLAAVAMELERRGKRSANVYLAVGLPLTRFGAEKHEFIDYLSKQEAVHFKYEQKTYDIKIVKVSVFPQCYSAVVDRIPAYTKKVLVVDIGSWTLDIMPIINKSPDESQCITAPQGLISCMREINKQCVRMFGGEIDESEIQQVMRYGNSDMDEKYLEVIKSTLV
ncbi:ParM/StbA family protein, partial [Anaerobium acetethylicum]